MICGRFILNEYFERVSGRRRCLYRIRSAGDACGGGTTDRCTLLFCCEEGNKRTARMVSWKDRGLIRQAPLLDPFPVLEKKEKRGKGKVVI